jgi:hypothetical protein
VLEQTGTPSLRVFVVWEPMLPTDWQRPSGQTLGRISDGRAAQYWDEGHLIAGQVKQQLRGQKGPACCEDNGILWDMLALYPPGAGWSDAAPVFDDGPVYRVAPELGARIAKLPAGPTSP